MLGFASSAPNYVNPGTLANVKLIGAPFLARSLERQVGLWRVVSLSVE
jgi:hypothetical protein